MHEKAGVLIAAWLALACGAAGAQKDAAEKAREGGIEHWIEYYKAEKARTTPAEGERGAAEANVRNGAAPAGKTAGKAPTAPK